MAREWIGNVLVECGAADGTRDARRLVMQGGVFVNGEPITDPDAMADFHEGYILGVGQRKVYRYSGGWQKVAVVSP